MQRFSPRSKGLKPHIRLLSPGVLHWEDEPPGKFDFEGQQGLLSGEPEGCGKKTPLLKVTHKISHPPRSREEAVI